ncbi:uncharacterized protein si:cabz01068815.1 [Notolabrus celidotus]|uniref:uncharacterized protein si:cabz01068815.1 n=1 Tax=Notolabrus celidotus TaxID=1203425 RepID=UPI001490672B|nr:uncharacterized protein si:cabz01068815.1 [Notolabrus celidotus]
MFAVRIYLFLLLLAPAVTFMVFNSRRSLCLQDSAASGEVMLSNCDLDSEAQQWTWIDQSMLVNIASSRCLRALQGGPLRTQSCRGSEVDPAAFLWDCDRDRLISRNSSMLLSIDGGHPVLSHNNKQAKWKSVDGGDICLERLRSRRASHEPDEFEESGVQTGERVALTEEQKQYLRWFYRTEDPTTWKFVLLGLAFFCLLIGFLLLGMGAMANKNRKKIAKYKAAAAQAQMSEGEQLRLISVLREDSITKPSPSPGRLQQGNKPPPSNGEPTELRAGDIVVTWKDGNTSCLYNDPAPEEEQQEEHQVEQQEEQHEEQLEEQHEEQQEEQQEKQQVEVAADESMKAEE